MKFLIVSQYFWPETFIITDLAQSLIALDHTVTVLTGKPNYPSGRIYKGYRASGIDKETLFDGIDIYRVPIRPRGTGGSLNLALNYLSFLFSGLLRFPRLIRGQQFDVVLFFAPSPMTSAITAIPLKYLTRSHLAIWIQDLWPESLSATGHVRNGPVLFLIRQIVRLIYRSADTLLIQSRAFHEPVARLAAEDKIVYYPNFYPLREHALANSDSLLPSDLRKLLDDSFCIVFAGNLGIAQSLSTIVDAASLLSDLPELKILLVGSGSMSKWVTQQIAERDLRNLVLPGRLPMDLMPALYHRAQGLLVTLTDAEIFSYTVPSKFQGYLAAGRPILVSANGETPRLLEAAGAGFSSEAEDSSALAENIRKLYHSTLEERDNMGKRGYAYFKQHFEMEKQTRRLVDILRQRIERRQV